MRSIMFKNKKGFVNSNLLVADKKTLENAVAYLRREKMRLKSQSQWDENCRVEDTLEARTDHQIKLRCRQLSSVVQEIRKAILRHDWKETATLLMILCRPGIKLYGPIIVKTCFILLFCHQKSNFKFLQNFIRNVTGFLLDEDINKFVKVALILRKSAFKTFKNTKCNYYKVTKDPEFDSLT